MMNALLRSALLLALVAALGLPAQAQRYEQYARAAMPSAQVIGMGDAGVGLAGPETAFFYNPAHFAKLGLLRPRIEILGVRAEASTKIFEDVDFFFDRVEPAISEGDGIDYPLDQDERDLFVDALAQGARPTVGQAAVMAPSVMFSTVVLSREVHVDARPVGGRGAGLSAAATDRPGGRRRGWPCAGRPCRRAPARPGDP